MAEEEAAAAASPFTEPEPKKKKLDNDENMQEATQQEEGMDRWEEGKIEYERDKALLNAATAAATAAVAEAAAVVESTLQPLPQPQLQPPGWGGHPQPAASSAAGNRPPTNFAMAISPTTDWKDEGANLRETRGTKLEKIRLLQLEVGELDVASDTEIGDVPSTPSRKGVFTKDADAKDVEDGDATPIPAVASATALPPTLPVMDSNPQRNSYPELHPVPLQVHFSARPRGDRWGTEVHPVVLRPEAPPQGTGPGTGAAGM